MDKMNKNLTKVQMFSFRSIRKAVAGAKGQQAGKEKNFGEAADANADFQRNLCFQCSLQGKDGY
jgi:hypothetical protein